jgi:hypothetical protein
MGWMFDNVGRLIARLQKPANHCEPFTPNDSTALRDTLRPGDVLLVEGKGHIVVKPTLARGFNYNDMHWADLPQVHTAQVMVAPEVEGAIAEGAYA